MTILVADDAAFMRMMLKRVISGHGNHTVLEAEDGPAVIKLLETERPDLIILDITMPGMSGLETLTQIRKVVPNQKVVMCSAMGQESMVIAAIQLGVLDFIIKPFKDERVHRILTSIETLCQR